MVTDTIAAQNVEIVHRGQFETVDILGIWCEWKTTEDETNHHYSVLEMTVPPGTGVPLHRHSVQETFTVLEGAAEFGRLGSPGEEWLPIKVGDVVNVPNWAYHGFRNSGTTLARIQLSLRGRSGTVLPRMRNSRGARISDCCRPAVWGGDRASGDHICQARRLFLCRMIQFNRK
jgi:quercetin dioxygenase-like cupin family protein